MGKYKTILFDLDGTLIDPQIGISKCAQYALNKMGHHIEDPAELLWFIGPPLRDSFIKYLKTSDNAVIEKAVHYYRERYATKGIFECNLYPGIAELLERLQSSQCQIILATSKAVIYAKEILQHFDIARYFSLVMGSNLDGTMCEKAEIVAAIIEQIPQADKKQTVMIGDHIYDIIGAQQNGIDSISVTYGYGPIEEIKAAGPVIIVNTVQELADILIR